MRNLTLLQPFLTTSHSPLDSSFLINSWIAIRFVELINKSNIIRNPVMLSVQLQIEMQFSSVIFQSRFRSILIKLLHTLFDSVLHKRTSQRSQMDFDWGRHGFVHLGTCGLVPQQVCGAWKVARQQVLINRVGEGLSFRSPMPIRYRMFAMR